MKKLVVYTLAFLLLSVNFCKKSSTESPEEYDDIAELRVMVTQGGQPYTNVLVNLDAVEMVNSQWEEGGYVHRAWIEDTYEDSQVTNSEGMARFILENLTVQDENVVKIKKIELRKSGQTLRIDSTLYTIPKGGMKTLNYDL